MHPSFSSVAVLTVFAVSIASTQAQIPICSCPSFPDAIIQTYIGTTGAPAIQCAYPDGACTWTSIGVLLDFEQDNCQGTIPAGTTACPPDREAADAALINHLYPFACSYAVQVDPYPYPPTTVRCDWDELGRPIASTNPSCPMADICETAA